MFLPFTIYLLGNYFALLQLVITLRLIRFNAHHTRATTIFRCCCFQRIYLWPMSSLARDALPSVTSPDGFFLSCSANFCWIFAYISCGVVRVFGELFPFYSVFFGFTFELHHNSQVTEHGTVTRTACEIYVPQQIRNWYNFSQLLILPPPLFSTVSMPVNLTISLMPIDTSGRSSERAQTNEQFVFIAILCIGNAAAEDKRPETWTASSTLTF